MKQDKQIKEAKMKKENLKQKEEKLLKQLEEVRVKMYGRSFTIEVNYYSDYQPFCRLNEHLQDYSEDGKLVYKLVEFNENEKYKKLSFIEEHQINPKFIHEKKLKRSCYQEEIIMYSFGKDEKVIKEFEEYAEQIYSEDEIWFKIKNNHTNEYIEEYEIGFFANTECEEEIKKILLENFNIKENEIKKIVFN